MQIMPEFRVRVSIVIPCRNEARYIARCLACVLAFEPVPGGMEVLVVDGMSDDGTRDVLARIAADCSAVRVIDNPARDTPAGLNRGIREANGEIILRIDVHTEYAADYLRQCVAVLEETGAENVGGPWVARGATYMGRAIAAAFGSPFAVGGARSHAADYEGPVDSVYLGCWRRETLVQIGLFDEDLLRNQDDELNYRLVRAGGRVWQSPRIRSYYTPRGSLKRLFSQYWQYGYWKVRVLRKHGRPASVRHLVPGLFAACLLILSALSPVSGPARIALAALLSAYGLALAVASGSTASRAGWSLLPVFPIVFACFHFGYGFGYLCGVWDFILCRRSLGRFRHLTRA